MKLKIVSSVLLSITLGSMSVASAQETHANHNMHSLPIEMKQIPTETGQSAFAAIAEIVEMLTSNPDTDWETVNIDVLRKHLVDMNALTLGAEAQYSFRDNISIFEVSGEGRVLEAIKSMVPNHARELNKIKGWTVSTREFSNGVKLIIQTDDLGEIQKIRALGFFGLMATGAHHQPHHWGMATGEMIGH